MSLFKKKPEPRSSSPRPKLRPANFNPTGGGDDPKSVAGSSGKGGGGQSAKPKYNPKAPAFKTQMKYFNEKGNINNDGKFGYGYIDEETGIEVPWYIDMINGGGANAAGDTFVSPYEGSLRGLPAQAATGLLNEMNIAPYGYNRSRYYMPKQAEGSTQAAAPKDGNGGNGGGGSSSKTTKQEPPVNPFAVGGGFASAFEPAGPVVAGHNIANDYMPAPTNMPQPKVYQSLLELRSDKRDLNRSNNDITSSVAPNIDPAMVGSDPSMVTSRLRKDLAGTVPQQFIGTDLDKLYQYYLQGGGTQNFSAFAQGVR